MHRHKTGLKRQDDGSACLVAFGDDLEEEGGVVLFEGEPANFVEPDSMSFTGVAVRVNAEPAQVRYIIKTSHTHGFTNTCISPFFQDRVQPAIYQRAGMKSGAAWNSVAPGMALG